MIQLNLTDEQARIVSRACEFYARMRYGQFWELIPETLELERPFPDNFSERRDNAEKHLLIARTWLLPELHGRGHSYGMGYDEISDRAYDVYQVLRKELGDERIPFSYYDLPQCKFLTDEKDVG